MSLLQRILEEQFKNHKDLQVQDMYKLFYQGTFGPEHLISEESREELYKEYEIAKPNKKENLFERISPSFLIYRVNIRPYKAFGGSKEVLFEWFYESSKINEGRVQDLLIFWKVFTMINKEKNYFSSKEIKDFENKHMGKDKLPVMHHSKQYKKANKPSYRVVNYQLVLDYIEEHDLR